MPTQWRRLALGWLLLALTCSVQAEARQTIDNPLSLRSEMLTPRFWIQRLDDAHITRLEPPAIDRLNQSLRKQDPSIHQLDAFQGALPAADVRARITALSVPLTAPRFMANGQAIDAALPAQLESSLALDTLIEPVIPRFGLVVRRAALRSYPTRLPLFKQPFENDLDRLQESALFPGDAVVVLHQSANGLWLFAVAERYAAWIESAAVAIGPRNEVLAYAKQTPALTVIGATASTVSSPQAGALSELRLDMGVRLPWQPQWPLHQAVNGQLPLAHWVVLLPQRQADGSLLVAPTLIARSEALAQAPRRYTAANIIRQGFRFLGERYGWGHAYNARDCSGFVAEVYRSMGILLPRNTGDQAASRVFDSVNFAAMSEAQRVQALARLDVGDLIYVPGHVMMVIGRIDQEVWLIHDAYNVHLQNADGTARVLNVNGVAITPLSPLRSSDGAALTSQITFIQRIRPAPAQTVTIESKPSPKPSP